MSQPINQYINAHLQWIAKLTAAIYSGQIPDRDTASVDNHCALGKWIYDEGGGLLHENTKGFSELREKHKQFHVIVGQIIDLVQAGKMDEAKIEMTSGKFRALSGELVTLLSKLRRSLH
ncbi:MAG: CZB domain-containing protein [Candidatus Competibacteraceae bacterium]|nr:CZB domain-containing protein [Candidatus Competibacteraceae bacterium]